MRFFFDANTSYRLAAMMAALTEGEHEVVHITRDARFAAKANRFGNSTPDVDWLGVLGGDDPGWNAISGDTSIIDTAHERAALIASGLTFFAFDDHFSHADKDTQAAKLVRAWPEIVRLAGVDGSAIFLVRTGKRPGIEKVQAGARVRGGTRR